MMKHRDSGPPELEGTPGGRVQLDSRSGPEGGVGMVARFSW